MFEWRLKGGRFPKASRMSLESAFRYLWTLFAPLGVLAFVQDENGSESSFWLWETFPYLVLKGSVVNPAAWTVAGALIQAPSPPKALTLSQFYHAPSILSFSLRGFDKTRSSHQLSRVIFYPLLRALRDCTLYILEASTTLRAKPDGAEQNPELFFTQKNEKLFCISGMNKWDFNKQVFCWRWLSVLYLRGLVLLCSCDSVLSVLAFPFSNSCKAPGVLFLSSADTPSGDANTVMPQ